MTRKSEIAYSLDRRVMEELAKEIAQDSHLTFAVEEQKRLPGYAPLWALYALSDHVIGVKDETFLKGYACGFVAARTTIASELQKMVTERFQTVRR